MLNELEFMHCIVRNFYSNELSYDLIKNKCIIFNDGWFLGFHSNSINQIKKM